MIAKVDELDFGKETKEKKKKKKKTKAVEEDALDMEALVKTKSSQKSVTPPDLVPEMPLLKKKKKKKKTQEAESPDRAAAHEDSMETETMGRTNSLKKHHSRKELLSNPPESPCQGKRKKTKSSLSQPPCTETEMDMEPEEEFVRKSKKRKKDKRSDQESFVEQEAKETPPDPKKEEEEKETECEPIEDGKKKQDPSSLGDSSTKKKKKKKKKTYREEEKEDEEDRTGQVPVKSHVEQPSDLSSCTKKGHKKKQPKTKSAESIPLTDKPRNIKKKEKKSKTQIEPSSAEELAQKKKTMESRKGMKDPSGPVMVHESDLEVISEKKGNLDEITIDTVRRKALQEEIDRESGKTEALETKVEAPTQFGQWDTATFESSDQKMKFLRLMGGFKNSSPSLSTSPGTLGKPNMALNKQAAATLQQNLQVEFDRAVSWKHQRGVGLGFSASENKNKLFYIDRNASRSVKFDD